MNGHGGRGRGSGRGGGRGRGGGPRPPPHLKGREIGLWYAHRSKNKEQKEPTVQEWVWDVG